MASIAKAWWLNSAVGKKVPSGVIVAWPSTNASIPAGWTRETALDSRFVKMVPTNATNPGVTGGSDTHNHGSVSTHTHSGTSHNHGSGGTGDYNSANPQVYWGAAGAGGPMSVSPHSHTVTITAASAASSGNNTADTYGSGTSIPPYFAVIFIKSDGSPSGIPNGAVCFFNSATPPTSWRACDGTAGAPDIRNRMLRGAAAAGDGGGIGGGTESHTHVSSGHTHSGSSTHSHTGSTSTTAFTTYVAGGASSYNENHSHTLSASGNTQADFASNTDSLSAGDGTPAWFKLQAIQNNKGVADLPSNVIVGWLQTIASIPLGYKICDGLNSTPNLIANYVKALSLGAELGTTGGATTHSHGSAGHSHSQNAHSHTLPANTDAFNGSTNPGGSGTLSGYINNGHSHSLPASTSSDGGATSGSASPTGSSATNDPAYTTIAWLQFQG